ncbi:hypothetical protein [Solilutibacter silvestris]|uniref:Glycosyl transferase family 2 n=1 Tax=Solilutibacter silvestris TaxID=1645665 RepID=A0A2K1PXC5_9GAMM|nr:hypothetical protein [Lysobacter silvestris]PNS07327.1 hypothetical protein Lysil_1503 [Lysobacter silvestris]
MVNDTWVITCYFNPLGYRSRRENFQHFSGSIAKQGGQLLVIELAAPNGSFDLDTDSYHCVRVTGNGLIWQKERMLNVALKHLPPECRKIVWSDGDLIFESADWLAETSGMLEDHVVVQLFDHCLWLPEGHLDYQGETQEGGEVRESFAACYLRDPSLSRREIYANHGHTGFAWAARRDFLGACGFYDGCITGSGDHLMAHVFAGALSSPCISKMIGEGHAYANHFHDWAERAHALCQGRLGCVPGRVLHLWHGMLEKRQYFERNQEFKRFEFDPHRDIRVGTNGLWEWAEASPALRNWAAGGFRSRDEDGAGANTEG